MFSPFDVKPHNEAEFKIIAKTAGDHILAATGEGELYKNFVKEMNRQFEQPEIDKHFPNANIEAMYKTTHEQATKPDLKQDFNLSLDDLTKGLQPEKHEQKPAPESPKFSL